MYVIYSSCESINKSFLFSLFFFVCFYSYYDLAVFREEAEEGRLNSLPNVECTGFERPSVIALYPKPARNLTAGDMTVILADVAVRCACSSCSTLVFDIQTDN